MNLARSRKASASRATQRDERAMQQEGRRLATAPTLDARRLHGPADGNSRRTSEHDTERMSQPLVSVTMVVCNVDRFLREAIESILGQTFSEFEFIVVDFGSTDNSKPIISQYAASDSRVKFHEIPHCGLAEARNAAAALAQGKYIAIMDADDVSVPERLAWELDFMEANPKVGVVGGAVEWIDSTGRPLQTHRHPLTDREIRSELRTHSVIWQPTAFIRRDAFGGYRGPFAPAEDYDLWLRIAERFQLANLERVVLKYRFHPSQVSLRKRTRQTLGILGAQLSASSRRAGLPDPLDSVAEITPEVLAAMGLTRARLQSEDTFERRRWIRFMCMAGEYAAALQATLEALESDLEQVERWLIADLQVTAARLYWRQGRRVSGVLSAAQAVLTHPVMVGRPLKPLLRRLGLV
jgi:Glycosyl transferase family 2